MAHADIEEVTSRNGIQGYVFHGIIMLLVSLYVISKLTGDMLVEVNFLSFRN